ncbi:MAG: SDR family oxidoreductase [Acidimicrobiia bacterium]|nr:SDR family oxidoreductase [Acidimicrobiia bacterium]
MVHHGSAAPADPRRVIVLGGSGFIGGALGRELAARGCEVARLSSRDLDLATLDAAGRLAAMLDGNTALVFASAVTREKGRDAATLLGNVTMAACVSRALDHAACAQVIYLSSDAVYGDEASNPVTEATPCNPGDLYGVMHLVREKVMQEVCGRRGVPLAIVRPSLVYGPGDTHGSYGPNRWVRTAQAGEGIALFGEGEERRDLIFIDELVALVIELLRHRSEGILGAATGVSHSFAEMASTFMAVTGAHRAPSLPRQVAITHREYDVAVRRHALPSVPVTPLRDGLERTWAAARGEKGPA